MKKIFLPILICIPLLLFSQQKQPKVGLVLSGGGAKGFAHIGVLKEIEKAGLQIDYIGGTSMGAIVGGLYAIGYSADQIEEIIVETDFSTLIQDINSRESESFFEKEYGEKHFITLPVYKGKIGLPSAISKGQNVLNLLSSVLSPSHGTTNFSNFKIPFFCIGTDIETGEAVVLQKGSLPLSLRASGSFPTLLSPVEIDGKLLIDGGVANNFPVKLMKAKGMDFIIGVDVQGKLNKKGKIRSAINIINQIVSYQMYGKLEEDKKLVDIYMHPDVLNYTVIDFESGKEILQKGQDVASEHAEAFKKIAALQKVKRKEESKKLNLKDLSKKFKVTDIKLFGNEKYTRAFILGKLNILEGDSISHKVIVEKIANLSSTNNFERILYYVEPTKTGNRLTFSIQESDLNANLRIGLHYDYLYKSSILANYNHKGVLTKNDMLALDLILGDNLRYNFTYFVDNGFYTSFGFRSRYNHFRSQVPYDNPSSPNISSVNLRYSDFTNEVFLQTTFGRRFAIGIGAEVKRIEAKTENIIPINNSNISDDSFYFNTSGYLKLDTYNKKYFPTKGVFADLGFKWYLFSSDFSDNFERYAQAKGKIGFATSFWNKFTFQYTGEAGFSLDQVESGVFDFYLGGNNQNYINNFVSLYGYEFAALGDDSFVKSEFNVRYQFLPKHYFSVIANYARLDDNVFKNIDLFKNIKSGYAVGYSYNSFIGPIELKYAWTPDINKSTWLFNLGFWF
ncbi:patatin [Polaribacter aestuariivivens]|uniref:Patatin n=1 Tax=Polaribacter aestuariivivens TaxID=2304626 RepID=A0A5S3NB08_9FLAO|nr:patatin-like phospholipase family protein [Polaribacter aestuariivivens]TMM32470.1 patatin [Polaribacter aestuariivivens]